MSATTTRTQSRRESVDRSRAATRPPLHRDWRRLAPLALFFAVAASVIGFHMVKYPYLSPIDENAQFDYIRILPEIPSGSGTMSQDSLRLTACRGYAPDLFDQGLVNWDWPPCRSKSFDPNAFPAGGKSTAGSTAPLYYFLTAAMTRPIAYVVDIPLFLLIRAASVLWLTALMTVSYLVARRIRAPKSAAAAAAVIVGTSSDIVTSAATIGPDTATAVTGGLIILAALAYDGSRKATLLLLGAVAVGGVTKLTVFTAVGIAMVILLGRALLARRRKRGRELLNVVGVVAAVFAVFTALSLAWFLRPVPEAAAPAAVAPGPAPDVVVPWTDVLTQLFFNFLAPNSGNYNASFLEGLFNSRLEQLMVGLMMISVLTAALSFRRNVTVSALGWGLGLMLVAGPVILTLLNEYAYNVFYALPPRYGYGLLAGLAAVVAWTFRGAAAARALVVVAAVSFVSVFV